MIFCLAKILIRFLICFVVMIFVTDVPLYSSVFYPSDQKHKRVAIRHIEGGGVGYNKGYTTLEAFLAPDPEQWRAMPFLDLRGHVFNTGKLAVNAGGGVRGIARDRVYGGSVYYDFRNTEKGHYNQMGLGLETLGRRCDVRVNGYLPFKKTVLYPSNLEFAGFKENQMIISQDYQLALRGVNAELSVHCGKKMG